MTGTIAILPNGQRVIFQKRLSEEDAKQQALSAWRKMKERVENPIEEAEARFEEFNNKPAKSLDSIRIDRKTPLIKIGTVGEIHYTSSKEGKAIHYVHFLKKKGAMYGHPRGKFFVILAPSTRVEDWLIEEGENPRKKRKRNPERMKMMTGDNLRKLLLDLSEAGYNVDLIDKPDQRLAARNIEKAQRIFDELSPAAKERVADQRAWVMKVAWRIQRGTLKEYGHK